MKIKLKSLSEQTIVITGATSGIGLSTARLAAEHQARLVLAARSEDSLRQLTAELRDAGCYCNYVVADVGNERDIIKIVDKARAAFGGFDTWINNAGVSIYGEITEVATEDFRRLFETNFWGVVYGSRAAVSELEVRGGALINVGSVLSDTAMPLQGVYSASKHAVKAFTDALRIELEARNLPISVTLIKPAAIDTPYPEHAKNYLTTQPKNPSPLYTPREVAKAILAAAEYPKRDVIVGGAGVAMSSVGSSYLADYVMGVTMNSQRSTKPADRKDGALHSPSHDLRERGRGEGIVFERSLYTRMARYPLLSSALALGALSAGILLQRSRHAESER